MDFAAWFEAYLGEWHNFDAHNKTPRVGRAIVLIAFFGDAQPDRLYVKAEQPSEIRSALRYRGRARWDLLVSLCPPSRCSIEGDEKGRTVNEDELLRLQTEARYARERFQLYKARVHGPRPTDPSRLRELDRSCRRAETRLRRARTVPANN